MAARPRWLSPEGRTPSGSPRPNVIRLSNSRLNHDAGTIPVLDASLVELGWTRQGFFISSWPPATALQLDNLTFNHGFTEDGP